MCPTSMLPFDISNTSGNLLPTQAFQPVRMEHPGSRPTRPLSVFILPYTLQDSTLERHLDHIHCKQLILAHKIIGYTFHGLGMILRMKLERKLFIPGDHQGFNHKTWAPCLLGKALKYTQRILLLIMPAELQDVSTGIFMCE